MEAAEAGGEAIADDEGGVDPQRLDGDPQRGPEAHDTAHELPRFYSDVRRCIGRIAPSNVVDDLVQETYAQAFKTINNYGPPKTHPRRWLLGVAKNTACTYFRRLKGQAVELSEEPSDPATPGPLEALVLAERVDQVPAALSRLTASQQALIRGRYWDCKPIGEMASSLSTTEMAVRLRLYRARQRLHRSIQDLTYGSGTDEENRRSSNRG